MSVELCPYCGEREQVRGLPPHEGSLHERIRALEAELATKDGAILRTYGGLDHFRELAKKAEAERDALKARAAELEEHICCLSETLGWPVADALNCGHTDILGAIKRRARERRREG